VIYKNLVPEFKLKFESRDIWIGVFWDYDAGILTNQLTIYLCLLPMLPLRLRWTFFGARWHDWQRKRAR
jgi:hypothetical protein